MARHDDDDDFFYLPGEATGLTNQRGSILQELCCSSARVVAIPRSTPLQKGSAIRRLSIPLQNGPGIHHLVKFL